jgi:hypothetical protein
MKIKHRESLNTINAISLNWGFSLFAILIVQVLLFALPGGASSEIISDLSMPQNKIAMRSPWLHDASSYIQKFDLSKGEPGLTSRGAYGTGNGYVFGMVGLGMPQNMLTGMAGPNYEKDEAEQFFPVWEALSSEKEGMAIRLTQTTSYRVRSTPIVVNVEKNDELSMTTVTFAPPLMKSIIRIISVRNLSGKPVEGLSLDVQSKEGKDLAQIGGEGMLSQVTGGKRMIVGFAVGGRTSLGKISLPIGTLGLGQEYNAILIISFLDESDPVSLPEMSSETAYKLLEETRRDSLNWTKGVMTVTSSDLRLADLFDSLYNVLKSQLDANSGGISQMGKYSGIWCRDTFGPVRFLLTAGKFDAVSKMLRYYDYATRMGGFRNRYPLDLDISKAPEKVDWESMTPQQGDDPNLLILQYYWYYRATGDKEFVKEHYGFLRRNFSGQKQTDYRFTFNGDETYQVYVLMSETAPLASFYSADTSFEYTLAARAMSEMAAAIGEKADSEEFAAAERECREKTEQYYWNAERGYYIPYVKKDTLAAGGSPFADIDLRPIWNEYAAADAPNQRENVINTAKKLMNKRGTMKSSARVGLYTGMVPGMLLWNLKAVGLMDRADITYGALMNDVISPAGEFAEAYDAKDRWINYGTAPTVFRSWESAINVEAILYYITGLGFDYPANRVTFQPSLPPGVDWVKFDNLYAGRNRFSVLIRRIEGGGIEFSAQNTGDRAVEVELLVEPAAEAQAAAGFETFVSAAYARTLWRRTLTLAPGESFRASGG